MAEIVNLRLARKKKRRAEKDAEAEANRRASGRSKAERTETERLRALDTARLDAHRRMNARDEDGDS
jgi:hypothetical protein